MPSDTTTLATGPGAVAAAHHPVGYVSPLEGVSRLAGRYGLLDIARRCDAARAQAGADTLTVAVLGRFKAGKSTLLNGLAGSTVLPVQAIPATSVITRLCHGERLGARVRPRHGRPFEIDPGQVADWVTETGNPNNLRDIDELTIVTPGLGDLSHLELVDTPGIGSAWAHNTDASMSWLPNVGAGVVAIPATEPLADQDLELIEQIEHHTPYLVIVVTKVDLLSADDQREVLDHVRTLVHDRIGAQVRVLPLSAAAGYERQRDELRELLRQWNRSHSSAVQTLTGHRVRQLVAECQSYLLLTQAAAAAQDESVDKLLDGLDEERRNLPELAAELHGQIRQLQGRIEDRAQRFMTADGGGLTRRVSEALATEMAGWHGSLAGETAQFRQWLQVALTEAIQPRIEQCGVQLEPFADQVQGAAERAGHGFMHRLGQLVHDATGVDLALPVPRFERPPADPVDAVIDVVFDSHLEMLSWMLPMALIRPSVHRHFQGMIPWEVEKNLLRAGYRCASAGRHTLDECVDAYVAALRTTLASCTAAASVVPDSLSQIELDLEALAAAMSSAPVEGGLTSLTRPPDGGATATAAAPGSVARVRREAVLLRHGRTAFNADGRLRGHLDPPLDEVGLAEVEAAARQFAGRGIVAIVTSPLARARQTAEAVAAVTGVPIVVDGRLIDRDYRHFAGARTADVIAEFGSLDAAPEVEPRADVEARARACLAEHTQDAAGPVVFVSHDAVIHILVESLGAPDGLPVPTASVTTLVRDDLNRPWRVAGVGVVSPVTRPEA